MNSNSRIELRNFRWVLAKNHAMIAIKNEENIGLSVAKQIYEKLDKFVEASIFIVEPASSWEEYNYVCFLERFKKCDIIDFTTYDSQHEKEQQIWVENEKKLKQAQEWLSGLSPKEQEMVKTLMHSMIPIAG